MGRFVRFFGLMIIYFYTCHSERAEALETSRKDVTIKIFCSWTNYTEHYVEECEVVSLTVNPEDSFPVTNLTVLKLHKDIFKPLTGTCFVDGQFQTYTSTSISSIDVVQSFFKSNDTNGYAYDVTCTRHGMHLYYAEVTNYTDGCYILPLQPLNAKCWLSESHLTVDVSVLFQLENGSITVISKNDVGNNSVIYTLTNETTPDFIENKFRLNLLERECEDLRAMQYPPSRCLDNNWNLYAWMECSKSTFGLKIPHLDETYDNSMLGDIDEFCVTNYPKMENCLKNHSFCEVPNRESFKYYSRLQKSYQDICANLTVYLEGHNCMQRVLSDEYDSAKYFQQLNMCSVEDGAGDVDCKNYSTNILCKAYSQYVSNPSCASFSTTYTYKRISEDLLKAKRDCTSMLLNPCQVSSTTYVDICSGCQQKSTLAILLFVFSLFVLKISW